MQFIFCVLILFSVLSCDQQGLYMDVCNETNQDLILNVETVKGEWIRSIGKSDTTSLDILRDEIIAANVVKSDAETNVVDNAYSVDLYSNKIVVTNATCTDYIVKVLLSDDIDVNEIFLTERNGKLDRYVEDGNINKVALSKAPVSIELYSDNPEFVLIDSNGNEVKLIGDYPIDLVTVENTIIIF